MGKVDVVMQSFPNPRNNLRHMMPPVYFEDTETYSVCHLAVGQSPKNDDKTNEIRY